MKQGLSKLLVFFMVFLFIGTSNHCFIEDLVATLTSDVLAAQTLDLGHEHDESSESSHGHGEIHSTLALVNEENDLNLSKLIINYVPLIFISKFALEFLLIDKPQAKILSSLTIDPPGLLRQFIVSLTLASQAPPSAS